MDWGTARIMSLWDSMGTTSWAVPPLVLVAPSMYGNTSVPYLARILCTAASLLLTSVLEQSSAQERAVGP